MIFNLFFLHCAGFDHQIRKKVKIIQISEQCIFQGFILTLTPFLITSISSIIKFLLYTNLIILLEGQAFYPEVPDFARGKNACPRKLN